jgi:predicted membrane protein
MEIQKLLKKIPMGKMTTIEMIIVGVFILYLLLPIETPEMLAFCIDSSLGMLAIFVIAAILFFKSHPLIAILFIFVAFELIKRSCNVTNKPVTIMEHTEEQHKKDKKMKNMNPEKKSTLEEEVVDKMAPVGHSEPIKFFSSSFQPVAEDVGSASKV